MTKKTDNILAIRRDGFTLIEVVLVVSIASMIVISVLALYSRARETAVSISNKISEGVLPREVLQLIAEDVDKMATMGVDTTINIENKLDTASGKYNKTKLSPYDLGRTINDPLYFCRKYPHKFTSLRH